MNQLYLTKSELVVEFNRQVQNLIAKNYVSLSGLDQIVFLDQVNELLPIILNQNLAPVNLGTGYLPFVVVSQNLINSKDMVKSIVYNNKHGVDVMRPREPSDFRNIPSEIIPTSNFYLICNVYRGEEYLNITPEIALVDIKSNQNTPLSLNEGIAIVTHFPEFLQKNKCFSLPASRYVGDQRVPAIWINSKKEANLGWCWDRNPHSWLGSGYCKNRLPI